MIKVMCDCCNKEIKSRNSMFSFYNWGKGEIIKINNKSKYDICENCLTEFDIWFRTKKEVEK